MWITEFTIKGSAKFNDWRLKTIVEAMNLMEPKQRNNLYIEPNINSKNQNI